MKKYSVRCAAPADAAIYRFTGDLKVGGLEEVEIPADFEDWDLPNFFDMNLKFMYSRLTDEGL